LGIDSKEELMHFTTSDYRRNQWELRLRALAAYDAWTNADNNGVNVESGKEALQEMINCFEELADSFDGDQHIMEIRAWRVANAGKKLMRHYNDFNGDLSGEPTMKVHNTVKESGL
jgi:hypothetical protein